MNNIFSSLLILFFFSSVHLSGQTSGQIEVDRPDQTECASTVPPHYFQMENGISFERSDKSLKSFSLPSTLWKYGVNNDFEIRLITEYISVKDDQYTSSGLLPVTVGFKTMLSEEKGIFPTTAFLGHLTSDNLGSKDFKSNYIAPSFRFSMQHTLSPQISLGYNLGMEWDGNAPAPSYIYTLTSGISLAEKLGLYLEVYGFIPDNSHPDHRFDSGFTYLLSNDFIVDLSGGLGLSDVSPDYYVALGFSFRLKT